MSIRRYSRYARMLWAWISLTCALFGCTPKSTVSFQDLPLSEFIIGEWKITSIVNADTGESFEGPFPTVSIYKNDTSYGDVIRAEYSFIEENVIFVDNKRLKGGETWRLEKGGENLIVYEELHGVKFITRLERITR